MRRMVYEVAGGRLVRAVVEGVETVCLKADRLGRDYTNHYLLPLDPLPGDRRAMALLYADPEMAVTELGDGLALAAAEEPAGTPPAAVGDVAFTGAGRYIKVRDTARTERHYCYVEIASGDVRHRQDRHTTAVGRWRLEAR